MKTVFDEMGKSGNESLKQSSESEYEWSARATFCRDTLRRLALLLPDCDFHKICVDADSLLANTLGVIVPLRLVHAEGLREATTRQESLRRVRLEGMITFFFAKRTATLHCHR